MPEEGCPGQQIPDKIVRDIALFFVGNDLQSDGMFRSILSFEERLQLSSCLLDTWRVVSEEIYALRAELNEVKAGGNASKI